MSQQEFLTIVNVIAEEIGSDKLDKNLETKLNLRFPADGQVFIRLKELCHLGEKEGWLLANEAGGIKFSRPVKPDNEAGMFSVDVVRMDSIKGPHHVHTTGEIGAIMPLDKMAEFDNKPEGWYVYPAGSSHFPTVTGGAAYILYLLPEGKIEFTNKPVSADQ